MLKNKEEITTYIISDNNLVLSALGAEFSVLGFKVFYPPYINIDNLNFLIQDILDRKIDFLLFDLDMKDNEAMSILAEIKRRFDFLIFLYCGEEEERKKEFYSNLGFNYFFSKKEYNFHNLALKIKKILKNIKYIKK